MPNLSAYEMEREENIRKNQELLKSLGLFKPILNPAKRSKPDEDGKENSPDEAITRPSKRRKDIDASEHDTPHSYPTRASRRLSERHTRSSRDSPSVSGRFEYSSDPIDFLADAEVVKQRRQKRRYTDGFEQSGTGSAVVSSRKRSTSKLDDQAVAEEDEEAENDFSTEELPTRDTEGTLHFRSNPDFVPNVTPQEMLTAGSFGGTAFKSHFSRLLKAELSSSDYLEFPASWYRSLDVKKYLTSSHRNPSVNKYGVNAGQTLDEWEAAGWVRAQDPRGWFQWYARYYLGRRSADDERQVKRWIGVCGPTGRFKRSLVRKIREVGGSWDDTSISPVLRQTLLHWGYTLTEEDYEECLR